MGKIDMNDSKEIHYLQSTKEDIKVILDILKTYNGDSQSIDPSSFIVAKSRDSIIGCIRLKKYPNGICELSSLVVLPEYRNRGVGSTLIRKLLENNIHRPLYLLCNRDKNKFYQSQGFDEIAIDELPEVLYKDYLRVSRSLPEIKESIIAMKIS